MTTGNVVTGQQVFGPYGQEFYNYKTRVWSGSDSPRVTSPPEYIDASHEVSYIRVKKGRSYIVIKYKRRILKRSSKPPKRLGRPENDFSLSLRTCNYIQSRYKPRGSGPYWYGPICAETWGVSNPIISHGWTSNDDISLLGKLREEIAGSDFNAGVFLAESPMALQMITQSATRIYQAYKAARKGDFIKARRYLVQGTDRSRLGRKVTANNWLELQYGWLPLLKDCESGARFIAQQFAVPPKKTFYARSSKSGTVVSSSPANSYYTNPSVVYRKQIKAILSETDIAQLSGLTDPLSVAWELVPYSFVIDWFIPIGNYLSARGLSQSVTGKFVTTITERTILNGWASPSDWEWENSTAYSQSIVNVTRTISNSLDVPLPSFKPLSKVPSWTRAANAVALLAQLK